MALFGKTHMVDSGDALPGRATPVLPHPAPHTVLRTPIAGDGAVPDGAERIYLAMGCFWGAEEIFWQLPGVITTSVGYMGGFTPNPTYEEVCTGRTGHTETTEVVYDPRVVSTYEILRTFWEHHDPTQGYRQGNDLGTQYRSAVFVTDEAQRELARQTRDSYATVIAARGYPDITTQILDADEHPYYLAEDHHQQYLDKHPHGYRCHANTGVALPALAAG